MGSLLDHLRSLDPEVRIAVLGLLAGLVCNLLKRHPSLPAKWVPHASLALGFALTFVVELTSSLRPRDALTVAFEALLAGAFPVAGHKAVRPLWDALLGEASADRYLGQADPKPAPPEPLPEDPPPLPPPSKPNLTVINGGVVLLLAASLLGCPAAPPEAPKSPPPRPARVGKITETFEGAYGEARLALRGCCLKVDPLLWPAPRSALGDGVIAKTAILKLTGDYVVAFNRAELLAAYEMSGYEGWVGVAGHELGHVIDLYDGRDPTELSAHAWAGCALRLSGHGVADYARLVRTVTLNGGDNERAARDGYRLCGKKGAIPGSHAQRAAFAFAAGRLP